MSKVQQLEAEIARLPRQEFRDLARWFDEERARKWDLQIDEDAKNGKLEKLYEKLQAENKAQRNISLNEVIDDAELS
jgi:hypothetical protein